MVEHWCHRSWQPGPVSGCDAHPRPGRALNLTPYDQRSYVTVDGVAKTGQVSPKGTVAHKEWFDGHVDAKASPRSVTAKLSDLRKGK